MDPSGDRRQNMLGRMLWYGLGTAAIVALGLVPVLLTSASSGSAAPGGTFVGHVLVYRSASGPPPAPRGSIEIAGVTGTFKGSVDWVHNQVTIHAPPGTYTVSGSVTTYYRRTPQPCATPNKRKVTIASKEVGTYYVRCGPP